MLVFCNRELDCVLLSRGYEKRPTVLSVFEFSIEYDTCPLFEDVSSSFFSKQFTFEYICAIHLCVVQNKKTGSCASLQTKYLFRRLSQQPSIHFAILFYHTFKRKDLFLSQCLWLWCHFSEQYDFTVYMNKIWR